MSRWHQATCSAPNITVDAKGIPCCQTCDSKPDLDAIIREQAHDNPFPAPPPDRARGRMDLWWPRSVPYVSAHGPSQQLDPTAAAAAAAAAAVSSQQAPRASSAPPDTPSSAAQPTSPSTMFPSPIYSRRLLAGELRLACLEGPALFDPAGPVHLTLETYSLDNCPSYETVSYCWAGEDGDSTRRWPIYVGPHWDVMLHTKNCWELLRFVRPPDRWIRLVWVDAVCIDQGW